MIPPFFPPPPLFNLPPPPLPPPNFSGLTDTELRAMEGQDRANVEARIKVLRNIQVWTKLSPTGVRSVFLPQS
jgi:E3 ubiquitin-protein ligase synoviolin